MAGCCSGLGLRRHDRRQRPAPRWSWPTASAFDLLISDIGLPDGSGLDLMRPAPAPSSAVTGIALSGFGMEDDLRKSREAGFDAHLTKPINFQTLER